MKKVVARIALVAFLAVVIAYSLFPFFWMVMTSIKTEQELHTVPPTFFPKVYTADNYRNVFVKSNIPRYFVNSLVIATGATSLALVVAIVSAYGFARFRFRGRSLLLNGVLSSQMIPAAAMMVPLFLTLRTVGLVNTYLGLILVYLVFTIPLSVWMMTNYFYSISVSMEEAASIDGCSRLQSLIHIVLPVSLPGIVATGIYNFITSWNEFIFALVFATDKKVMTLPIGLAEFVFEFTIDWGGLMAASVLMTLPIVTIFFVMQRYFISGLTAGATKG
jgi:ABC-type glycerol-3-phosphate transport system permease component